MRKEKKRPALSLVVVLFLLAAPGTGLAATSAGVRPWQNQGSAADPLAAVSSTAASESRMAEISKQVVVRLAPGVDPVKIAQDADAQVFRPGPSNYVTLTIDKGTMQKTLTKLKSLLGVLGAEPSRMVKIAGVNSHASIQDALNVSDPQYGRQWSLAEAEVPQAWGLGADGHGITIAVVDTGVDLNHPDLKDNLVPGYNAILDSTDPQDIQDRNGHGTHVAGIAAAEMNGVGIVGVAYKAKIMPIKAMNKEGEGADTDIANGIEWAANHGAQIINLSLGANGQTDVLKAAIDYAQAKGCLIIAAAGNHKPGNNPGSGSNSGVAYPAADPGVVAVSAIAENGNIANFSDTGPQIALAAPGVDILSDYWQPGTGSTYAWLDGTSMASPFVAGAAALIWSEHPDWSAGQVRVALENGAMNPSDPARDSSYGFGIVDAYRSLAISAPPKTTQSPADISFAGGIVQDGGQASISVSIPPLAFSQTETVSLIPVDSPADFPAGITSAGPAFSLQWSDEQISQKILTLSGGTASSGKTPGYIFRWSGSRWLAVGGGEAGRLSAGVYQPGIYRMAYMKDPQPKRLAGPDRLGTAIQIAQTAFPTGADSVILARADDFPDALAGVPLAYKLHAPILLTYPQSLDPSVLTEIKSLAPRRIVLLGGPGAISTDIENQLSQLTSVTRLWGANRYATAGVIAGALGTVGKAVIVNGENFPDALAIASVAAEKGEPILLTPANSLAPETNQALRALGVSQSLVVGGEGVVSRQTFEALPQAKRLSGADRYGTGAAVMQAYPSDGACVYAATGDKFPDALTGGVLAAMNNTDIILVSPSGPTSAQRSIIESWPPLQVVALGGPGVLPDTALSGL